MTDKFAYSYDRQDFTGAYDSAEEAVRAAVEQAEILSNPPTVSIPPTPSLIRAAGSSDCRHEEQLTPCGQGPAS